MAAVERVAFVRRAQAAGLTLDQIRTVLEVGDDGHRPCPQVAAFVDERLAEVDVRLAELAHARSQLSALRARLDRLDPAAAADTRGSVCPAFDPEPGSS